MTGGRVWTLTFDDIPDGPNEKAGQHWTAQRRAALRWQTLAWAECQRQAIPPLARIRLSATIRRTRRQGDQDNDSARFKAVQDGLVRSGIVPNDTRRYVTWAGPVTLERGRAKGCTLTIEELLP